MAGIVQHAKIETRTARARFKPGRQPHWQAIITGRAHLGWQKREGKREGRWLLRRYVAGAYTTQALGRADDVDEADGLRVLNFEQALTAARAALNVAPGNSWRLTVRDAFARYCEFKEAQGQPAAEMLARAEVHILPVLGDVAVADLTASQLRNWLADLAATPAQKRPKEGRPQYFAEPVTEEDIRRRRVTANRVLSIVKATLNHAYDEGHVANRDAWSRKLKPFRGVSKPSQKYLTVAQAKKLIAAADPELAALARGALETGARYSELARLVVGDFELSRQYSTINIRRSKSGRPRRVVLTPEGAKFFKQYCAGRPATDLIFRTSTGGPWTKSCQQIPMRNACERAGIVPPISFHGLRHTWASLAAMKDVPLMVISRNLGHTTTAMVEKTYGHLAPSYAAAAIKKGGPRFE
jgi:integrase